jgi:pilus assembly protein CpaF
MEGDVITMQEIFIFERQGTTAEGDVVGRFRPTGIRPKAADRLASYGVKLGEMLFTDALTQQGTEAGRFMP